MITIVSEPKEFQLNKNPILLKLSTDNQFDPVGVTAQYRLTFTSGVADGDDFTLTMGDGTVLTFTFRNTPDASGLEITRSNDVSTLVVNIQSAFNRNYYIASHYTVAVSYNGVTSEGYVDLTALELGADFNISLSSPPVGMSISTTVAGVTQVEQLNFKFTLQILKRKKGESTWTIIERTSKPHNGTAVINIADCLDDEYWKEKLPNIGAFSSVKTDAVGQYKVRFAESWGLPSDVQILDETAVKYFTNGGLSRDDHFKLDFYDRFLSGSPPSGFMTWIAHTIDLYPDEFHIITYLRNNSTPAKEIRLYAEATALDGSKTTSFKTAGVVGDYDVVTLRIQPSEWALDESNLRSFKVWIAEATAPTVVISDTISFNYISRSPIQSTSLIYENGLGFFDTFNLRGDRTPKVNVDKTIASRASETYLESSDHYEFIDSIRGMQSWIVNTGHLSKGEMSRVYDLLLSEKVYLVAGTELIPVDAEGPSDLPLFNSRSSRVNSADITIKKVSDNRYGVITA